MSNFKIQKQWLPSVGSSEWDATFCKLKIILKDVVVTAYAGDYEPADDVLQIPAYNLAEWISDNWWPLLYEPHKNEEVVEFDRNSDYAVRHSFLAAQHGFVLPNVNIVPSGDHIYVYSSKHFAPFAEIKFSNAAHVLLPRTEVEVRAPRFCQRRCRTSR